MAKVQANRPKFERAAIQWDGLGESLFRKTQWQQPKLGRVHSKSLVYESKMNQYIDVQRSATNKLQRTKGEIMWPLPYCNLQREQLPFDSSRRLVL